MAMKRKNSRHSIVPFWSRSGDESVSTLAASFILEYLTKNIKQLKYLVVVIICQFARCVQEVIFCPVHWLRVVDILEAGKVSKSRSVSKPLCSTFSFPFASLSLLDIVIHRPLETILSVDSFEEGLRGGCRCGSFCPPKDHLSQLLDVYDHPLESFARRHTQRA